MSYPLVPDKNGVKIIPELMEIEKMYYCLQNDKVLLVYKDEQEFLNCYEIEEPEIVENIKKCQNPDEIERAIHGYLEESKHKTLK